MFSGEIPFYDDRVETRVILGVMRGKRPTRPSDDLSNVRGLSDEMWKLIEVCWDEEPMRRPPIARVVEWLRVLSQLVDDRPLDDLNQNPPSQTLYNGTEHPFSVLVGQRPPTPQPLEKDMPSLRGAPDGFHGVPLMTAGPSASPAYRYQPQPRYTVELLIQDLRPLVRNILRDDLRIVITLSRISLNIYGRIQNINLLSEVERVVMFTEDCMNGQILLGWKCAA